MRSKAVIITTTLLVATFLSACSGEPPDVSIDPTSGQPTPGGTIVYVTFAEPLSLNPRMIPGGVAPEISELISVGLTEFDHSGNVIAELASTVPDPTNGDVTADLKTVTWRLKAGLKWSDGSPLTSDDLRYTWEVCGDPKVGCAKSSGLTDVESVETPDDLTIILHYRAPYFDYKVQFRDGILPRNCADCGAPEHIATWRYSETVTPNLGPFSVTGWTHNESITLARNPNFYLPGRPFLDGIDITFRDDQEVFRQAIMNGEADVSPWLTMPAEAQIAELVDRGFTVGSGSSPYLNRLQLNLLDPQDRTKPHPILGDAAVREAILTGTDVATVTAPWTIPGIYEGQRLTARADLYGSDWGCNMAPIPYDLERARSLLDTAGWLDSDGDGVRDRSGQRMSLRVGTYTGFYQEQNVVIWIDELKKLGIDARAENYSATEFYSSYADGSPLFLGDWDLLYYDFGKDFGSDPHIDYDVFYRSDGVPSEQNAAGRNMNGVSSDEIDRLLDEAGGTTDSARRKSAYCQISDIVTNRLFAENWTGVIPNFQMSAPQLKGWLDAEQHVWFGSDAHEWYVGT